MIFRFPATTAELISANPKAWPDSVHALLRFHALLGNIRLLGDGSGVGRWYIIPKFKDAPITKTRVPYGKTLPPEAFKPCTRCGKPTHHPNHKYCSHDCSVKVRAKNRRACEYCGKENPRSDARFCSRKCVLAYRVKKRPPCQICGKPVNGMKNKFCSATCSHVAQKGRKLGTRGPL